MHDDARARLELAVDAAADDDRVRVDRGVDAPFGRDGQRVAVHLDGAVHVAGDRQRLLRRHLAFDVNGWSDLCRGGHRSPEDFVDLWQRLFRPIACRAREVSCVFGEGRDEN